MTSKTPIFRLSPELLRHIVDQIEPDPERTVPIDDRRFLSVESLETPPSLDSTKDIGRFRATCRLFAEVGAPLLFTLVKVRFSKDGLEKLERLAGWSHLARHVKKFSYLMPYFYSNGVYAVLILPIWSPLTRIRREFSHHCDPERRKCGHCEKPSAQS